ncbi:MAG: polysaccharide deacetylase family protein, partial [Peptostreptococcaceae bacterium]
THREMSSLTKEQLEVEFTENQKRYKEIFGKEAEAIAYPYGMWNEDVIEIARKYFDYAFSTIKDGYLLNDDVLEQYAIVRDVVTYEMGAKPRTLANMKPLIDRCKAENKLLIYCIHASEFAGQYATNQTVLNEVIDYIKSIGIQIVNHDVALAEKGNVFDVGTFNTEYVKISKSGAIKSSRNINLDEYTPPPFEGFNFNTTKVVAIDTPITELPLGISFNIVRNAQASSFPLGRSGTIITYHSLTDSDYNFQLYYPFGLTDGFYKRNWNKWSNPKNWSSFIEFKPSTIIKREVAGNFGSLAPNAQQSLDLDFTGAKVNDNVIVNFKSSPPKGILISSMISQANKVRIVLMNFDTANVDLTNAIFNVSVVS